MAEYTYEKKLKLSEKINSSLKKKSDMIDILTIITKHNPQLKITKNNNGYFSEFQNLTNITYSEIEKVLDRINKKTKNHQEDNKIINHSITLNNKDDSHGKKQKYTNVENYILNRVRYEENLKHHQHEHIKSNNMNTTEESDIESILTRETNQKENSTKKQPKIISKSN